MIVSWFRHVRLSAQGRTKSRKSMVWERPAWPGLEALMTPRQLESRISALRGSVRRLLALHGVSWVLGLIVPLVIVAGFADWLFHLDAVIRAVTLIALIGTLAWLAYSRVIRPLVVRFADLD